MVNRLRLGGGGVAQLELLLLWGFPARVVSKHVLQSLFTGCFAVRKDGRYLDRRMSVLQPALFLPTTVKLVRAFHSFDQPADFHLTDSDILL